MNRKNYHFYYKTLLLFIMLKILYFFLLVIKGDLIGYNRLGNNVASHRIYRQHLDHKYYESEAQKHLKKVEAKFRQITRFRLYNEYFQ